MACPARHATRWNALLWHAKHDNVGDSRAMLRSLLVSLHLSRPMLSQLECVLIYQSVPVAVLNSTKNRTHPGCAKRQRQYRNGHSHGPIPPALGSLSSSSASGGPLRGATSFEMDLVLPWDVARATPCGAGFDPSEPIRVTVSPLDIRESLLAGAAFEEAGPARSALPLSPLGGLIGSRACSTLHCATSIAESLPTPASSAPLCPS